MLPSLFAAPNAASCPISGSRSRTLRVQNSTGLGLLQASKPLARKGQGGCKNPTKPVPLRRLPSGPADVLVELTTSAMPFPACALPQQLDLPAELAALVALDTLQPLSLLPRLTQLEQRLAAQPELQRRAVAGCPAFVGFLERGLELVQQRGMGPAVPLQLLRVLALLPFGDDAQLRHAYSQLYRHLSTSLEDAIKRDSAAMTPQAVLAWYEALAAADLVVAPQKSSLVGHKLRAFLRGSKHSPQECLRLFVVFAALRQQTAGGFNPCNYDVSDIVSCFVHRIQLLDEDELGAAAAACAAFDWPLYRSPVWALDCIAQEAIRRLNTEAMSLGTAVRLLGQAVQAAHGIRPRLGRELEARIEQWTLQAMAGAATLDTVQSMSSWAEAEEAASALNNMVLLSFLAGEAGQLSGSAA